MLEKDGSLGSVLVLLDQGWSPNPSEPQIPHFEKETDFFLLLFFFLLGKVPGLLGVLECHVVCEYTVKSTCTILCVS